MTVDIITGKHHGWCFTLNNWTKSDLFAAKAMFNSKKKKVEYGIFGEEVGASGTPHLQGYVRFATAIGMQALSKMLCRASLRMANGNDEQNQTYCSKECTNVFEVGTVSRQGARNDITEVTQKIKNGEITLVDCMFDYPVVYVKYSRSLEKMFDAVAKPRSTQPQVHWRWGLSGTGKTRYCVETHPNHYIKDGTIWWNGYSPKCEAIIIDDFANDIPFRTLLRLTDRYVYQGQNKGGYVQINSPYIYITCEHPPSYYWAGNELFQITRRCTSVLEIK